MPSYSEDPVKNVISFRVNDEEKECLGQIARALGMNVSTLLRKSLNLLVLEGREGCLGVLKNNPVSENQAKSERGAP